MKKVILFSVIAISAVACGGDPKTEKVEEQQRDSSIQQTNLTNEQKVDSMMRAEEAKEKMDSSAHQGHDHNHSDHNHSH